MLLDTDIYSEVLKGKNVNRRAAEYEDQFGQFTISVLTVAEIIKGLQKSGVISEVAEFAVACDSEEVLLFDVKAAIIAGKVDEELEKRGLSIGRSNPLIAGIALAYDLTLATGNIRHFQRVADLGFPLRLINWRE